MTFNDFLIKYNIMETTKQMGMLTSEIGDNIRSNLLINKTLEGKNWRENNCVKTKIPDAAITRFDAEPVRCNHCIFLLPLLLIVAIHSYGSNKDLIRLFIFGKKKEYSFSLMLFVQPSFLIRLFYSGLIWRMPTRNLKFT